MATEYVLSPFPWTCAVKSLHLAAFADLTAKWSLLNLAKSRTPLPLSGFMARIQRLGPPLSVKLAQKTPSAGRSFGNLTIAASCLLPGSFQEK